MHRFMQTCSHFAAVSTATHAYKRCMACACMRFHSQVMASRVSACGCILPTEQTSASIAAHAVVAQFGPSALGLSQEMIQNAYTSVKARIKSLYKQEPKYFMTKLPASPAALLRENRTFALSLFSPEEPPVACPLNPTAVTMVRGRINLRGGKQGDLCVRRPLMDHSIVFCMHARPPSRPKRVVLG